jgi:hypothetical protein
MNRAMASVLCVTALLAWGAECPAQPSETDEAEIYAVALNGFAAAGKPFALVVSSDSMGIELAYRSTMFVAPSAVEDDLAWRVPKAKKETLADFVKRSNTSHAVRISVKTLDSRLKVQLVPQREIDAAMKDGNANAWDGFARRYPGADFIARLSPIGFDSEFSEALVYIHRTCKGLCGSGHLMLLKRTDGHWKVQDVHQFWIS